MANPRPRRPKKTRRRMAVQPADLSGAAEFIGRKVVLDTAGPITYMGTLESISKDGFVLTDADFRDRTEGHVTKEGYVWEARENGIRANRRRIFVFNHVVISLSALDDILLE